MAHVRDGGESAPHSATDQFLALVYAELHQLARQMMRTERKGHTLQPTALIHEAYLRLQRADADAWSDKAHFLRVAARAMRRVLVDAARDRGRLRRGGGEERVALALDDVSEEKSAPVDVVALEEALLELAARDPQLVQVVELRCFAGLRHPQIATALGVSLRSVERSWQFARAWLHRRLSGETRS